MAERYLVVTEDIPFGGVLAYTRGQLISSDAVERNNWQGYVAATGTKAAAEIQAEITGRDVAEFQTTSSRGAAKTQEG